MLQKSFKLIKFLLPKTNFLVFLFNPKAKGNIYRVVENFKYQMILVGSNLLFRFRFIMHTLHTIRTLQTDGSKRLAYRHILETV